MIERERINPGLDIGEVLQKKRSHIRVYPVAIRDWQVGAGATPHFMALLATRGLGELAQSKTVPNIPSYAWKLASAISRKGYKAGKWRGHASCPAQSPDITIITRSRPVSVPDFWGNQIAFRLSTKRSIARCSSYITWHRRHHASFSFALIVLCVEPAQVLWSSQISGSA
jgi:hypothetical protein